MSSTGTKLRSWSLQDAKAQFSHVVDSALRGEPQHVTRRGKPAVVVISEAEFRRLERGSAPGGGGFVGHLLRMPRGATEIERTRLEPRDVGLDRAE